MAALAVAGSSGCGGIVGSDDDGGRTNGGRGNSVDCPPAPLIAEQIRRDCADLDFTPEDCVYSPPHMLLSGMFSFPDYCNDCWLVCFDGILQISCTMQGCTGFSAVSCAGIPVEGGPCEQSEDLGNGECVAPGPGADVDAGVVNGSVCACNEPGPVWHCVEVGKLR
jgi:hypothetical protein